MQPESNTREKLIVCGTAFSCACAIFAAAIVLLIPLFGSIMQTLAVADLIQQLTVMLLLFGLPRSGRICGTPNWHAADSA